MVKHTQATSGAPAALLDTAAMLIATSTCVVPAGVLLLACNKRRRGGRQQVCELPARPPGARPASSRGSVVSMTLTATVVPFQLPRYTCGTQEVRTSGARPSALSLVAGRSRARRCAQLEAGHESAHAVLAALATLGPLPYPCSPQPAPAAQPPANPRPSSRPTPSKPQAQPQGTHPPCRRRRAR